MLPTPKKVTIVSGSGEGRTGLNAFDRALLAAGIGNLNLIRVSSILPPGVEFVTSLDIPPGSLTPTAYGYLISEVPGETIAAAVGIGFSERDHGMIMEFSGRCSKEQAEATVAQMVIDAFADRGMRLRELKTVAAEQRVEQVGAVVAAAALWY